MKAISFAQPWASLVAHGEKGRLIARLLSIALGSTDASARLFSAPDGSHAYLGVRTRGDLL